MLTLISWDAQASSHSLLVYWHPPWSELMISGAPWAFIVHQRHQPADELTTYLEALSFEIITYLACAHSRMFRVLMVYPAHKLKVPVRSLREARFAKSSITSNFPILAYSSWFFFSTSSSPLPCFPKAAPAFFTRSAFQ
jgi:hypothetical protein